MTQTEYDAMGRASRVIYPDGASLTNEYYLTGALKAKHGARTYPVAYTYDAQGRMKTMTHLERLRQARGRSHDNLGLRRQTRLAQWQTLSGPEGTELRILALGQNQDAPLGARHRYPLCL